MTDLVMALMPAHAALTAMAAAAIPPAPSEPLIRADRLLAKYIIISLDGEEYPIVFSRDLQHNDMLPLACVKPGGAKAVAAGFYQFISTSQVLCGGESQTLKLNSRIEDAEIIKRHLIFS